MRSVRVWLAVAVLAGVVFVVWWWLRPVATTVTVYFLRPDRNLLTLAPVSRTVVARGSAALVTAALQALLDGPTDSERANGLTSAIPTGTRLRGVQLREGAVRADFSRKVESGGGSASMLGRFWQIVYTATQFSQAPRVRILIEGQERLAMGGEGLIIDHPIGRPPTVPTF